MKNSLRAVASLMCLPLAAACLLGFAPAAARADDAASATGVAGPDAPATTGAGATPRVEGLQEVVVTATRREAASAWRGA